MAGATARGGREGAVIGWQSLLALFLLVYGAKSVLIGLAGSDLPYSDEWNFEALGLYRPYLAGTLDWAQMLGPYNEHRMFFTRVLLLGLFELRGGWDPILGMLVNALIHAGFAAIFAAYVWPIVPAKARGPVVALTAICFMLPLGFENTLMAMNSHFYLLLVLSFASITLVAGHRAFSPWWWLGFFAGLAANLTLASAALTPLAGLVVPLLQLLAGVRSKRWPEFAALGLLAATGLCFFLAVPRDAASLGFETRNIPDFLAAAVSVASLPLATIAGLAFVHAPLLWLPVRLLRSAPPMDARLWGVLGMAVWIAGQILAIAFSRPATALASRYFDIVVLLLPLDLLVLTLMVAGAGRARRWLLAYGGVWLVVIVAGLGAGSYFSSWRLASMEKSTLDAAIPKVATFVATGNRAALADVSALVFPDTARLGDILADPEVRVVLPAAIRPPESSTAAPKTMLKGSVADATLLVKSVLAAGWLWLALGMALAIFVLLRHMRTTKTASTEEE